MKILFLNYELGYEAGPRLLIGWSTVTYGTPSRWNLAFAAQACEVEVKDEREYLLMLRDIAAAWHLPLRRWLPVPSFPAEEAPPAAASAGGTPAGPTGEMPVPRLRKSRTPPAAATPTRSRARHPVEA